MKTFKTAFSIILVIVLIGTLSGLAVASAPPGIPTVRPVSGGSGGGSSSSYSAPSFQPFVMTLMSSNGSPIGTITGKSEFSILLSASNSTTIDGKNFSLSMNAEMGQKPSDDTRMDISLLKPDSSGLPIGMDGATVLGVVNITRQSGSGWNLKIDTLKLTFSVPGVPGADPNNTYYLVRYDSAGYSIQKVTLKDNSAGILTFEAAPSSDSGLFTLVMAQPFSPTPTPTATPTPVPTSTPTPTPEPSAVTPAGIGILVAIFAVGAIAGGALIFIVFRK